MDFLTIGSLTIATKWIFLFAALVLSYIILKMAKKSTEHSAILDGISNSLFWGFLILKVSLIIVEPGLVSNNPLSLLYFTGGTIGFWLAVIIASTIFFMETTKKKISIENSFRSYGFYTLLSFSIYHLISAVVNPGLDHLLFFLFPFTFLIGMLVKRKNGKMIKNLLIIMVLLTLSAVAVDNHLAKQPSAANPDKADRTGVQKGEQAIDFSLKTMDGKEARLSDYKGKKVILNFWATWCPPCKAEMPHMEAFYERNKDDNIVILAVNLTNGENNPNKVENFAKEYGLTFPILMDTEGDVGNLYQAITIPTSYIIDTNGVIQQKVVGPMSKETMESLIKKLN